MTRKIFTLLLILAGFITVQAQLEIKKATKAPVVDGYLDDVDDPWGPLMDFTIRNPGGSTTGLSGKFNLLAGADAFYLAIVVQDATPYNDATAIPNSYERDCAEIFFSLDTVSDPSAYKVGSWQIRCQREGETLIDGNSGANTWSVATLTADPNFMYASETSATEYVQEFIFPYATLSAGMDPAWAGEYTRFDVAIADNTSGVAGGRTEQKYWYGHGGLGDDHGWDNTRAMGVVKLPGGASTSLNAVKASAFVSNNVLTVKNVNGLVNLYDVKGTLVRKSVINGNGTIGIADLKSGLYIVKSDNLSMKFVK